MSVSFGLAGHGLKPCGPSSSQEASKQEMAEAVILSADEEALEVQSDRTSHRHEIVDKKTPQQTKPQLQSKTVHALWCSLLTSFLETPTQVSLSPMNEFTEAALLRPFTCLKDQTILIYGNGEAKKSASEKHQWLSRSIRQRCSLGIQKEMKKLQLLWRDGPLTCLIHGLSYGPISWDRRVWVSCTSHTVSGRVSDNILFLTIYLP